MALFSPYNNSKHIALNIYLLQGCVGKISMRKLYLWSKPFQSSYSNSMGATLQLQVADN